MKRLIQEAVEYEKVVDALSFRLGAEEGKLYERTMSLYNICNALQFGEIDADEFRDKLDEWWGGGS